MKRNRRIAAWTLAAALCLSACGTAQTPGSTPPSTEPAGTAAALPGGIPAMPVVNNLETAAETSQYTMAETENGFYLEMDAQLLYADKSDLSNWVVVCNQPDCGHTGMEEDCAANLWDSPGFRLLDGRIYYLRSPANRADRSKVKYALASIAPDGTNLQEERLITEIPVGGASEATWLWTKEGLYHSRSGMGKDGNFENVIVRLTGDSGVAVYRETSMDWRYTGLHAAVRGDVAVYSELLSGYEESNKRVYRFLEDGYEEIPEIARYSLSGAYLNGNDLYRFQPGDGYYFTDLSTGESVKWMDAQLEESDAFIFGTNFVMETNFQKADPTEMRLYDGQRWRAVTLPEDFGEGEKVYYGRSPVLTSRYLFIFTSRYDPGFYGDKMYAIDLTAENLTAVLCATFCTEYVD